ncbi:MAG: glutamine synthetase type III, partial [Fusobacterium sp.]|nr:glutamine synthetase type III [Fusobacterium sp.]
PTFVLNTIIADVLKDYAKYLESALKTQSIKNAIISLVKERYPKHKRIIFNGNGYEQKWVDEATKRGLPNLKNTIEGLPALIEENTMQLFERNDVLTRSESMSRFHVYTERYNKQCNIEISTAIRIARNQIYPFVIKYISNLAKSIHRARKIFNEEELFAFDINLLREIILLKNDIVVLTDDLDKKLAEALKIEADYHRALFYHDNVLPILKKLRTSVDALELKIASDAWPIPSYYDLLFNL